MYHYYSSGRYYFSILFVIWTSLFWYLLSKKAQKKAYLPVFKFLCRLFHIESTLAMWWLNPVYYRKGHCNIYVYTFRQKASLSVISEVLCYCVRKLSYWRDRVKNNIGWLREETRPYYYMKIEMHIFWSPESTFPIAFGRECPMWVNDLEASILTMPLNDYILSWYFFIYLPNYPFIRLMNWENFSLPLSCYMTLCKLFKLF